MAATKSSVLVLFLASLFTPTFAVPTRSNCRCIAVEPQPWTELPSVRSSLSNQPDRCSYLAAELEYWQAAEPKFFETEFQHWIKQNPTTTPTPTSAEEELKPMSTTELMALSKKKAKPLYDDAPLPSAPTQRPRQRILCRPEVAKPEEYRASDSTLAVLTVIVLMALLAFIAEAINLIIGWFERKQETRIQVQLSGDEKALLAFSTQEEEPRKQKYYAYQVECYDDDDEEYAPVL